MERSNFTYFRLGNGYSFRTSHGRNPESSGLLRNQDDLDNTTERDTLLGYEEPAAIYTGATFVNGDEINLNGYLGRSSLTDDDDDEDVAFDLSSMKKTNNHTSVDLSPSS